MEVLAGLAALATIWAFLQGWPGSVEREPGPPGAGETELPVPIDPPGPPPVSALPDVVICEVVVRGPGRDPEAERVTLCNRGPEVVDLGGWSLEDNHGEHTIPRGRSLGPHDRWSVTGRELNPTRDTGGFWLNDGGDLVRLIDSAGTIVDECGWPPKESSGTCLKTWS